MRVPASKPQPVSIGYQLFQKNTQKKTKLQDEAKPRANHGVPYLDKPSQYMIFCTARVTDYRLYTINFGLVRLMHCMRVALTTDNNNNIYFTFVYSIICLTNI